ncbi:MAG: DUF488 domain-containing protein [Actinomycetota bacterium]|nr:DUF488 domain-containing protein [Actinomycetota bacterium]
MPEADLADGATSTVFTLGHGTRTTNELVRLARSGGAHTIVDIRRFPGSKRNPHLAREALVESLPEHGLAYVWKGEELGGRRSRAKGDSRHPAWRNNAFRAYADHMETDAFNEGLEDVVQQCQSGRSPALMCAETVWWRCHRRLVADALVVRGIRVIHLIDEKTSHEHTLHEAARVEPDGSIVYDVGVDREIL